MILFHNSSLIDDGVVTEVVVDDELDVLVGDGLLGVRDINEGIDDGGLFSLSLSISSLPSLSPSL